MSAFANLMALSATQTKQQESAVEMALRERQRKETELRRQQEAKEAKEREQEKKRRLKILEDQKREDERRKRVEEAKKLAEQRARERERDDALSYGSKQHTAKAGSSSKSKEPLRKPLNDDSTLSREELRQQRIQREMKRLYGDTNRSSPTRASTTQRTGRKLPGGAVNMTAADAGGQAANYKSVKARINATPNFLVKLNQNKRDTRTIDEIVQDRAKVKETKILHGEDARGFTDWFGSKKEPEKKTSRPSSVTPTSGTNTPSSSHPQSAQKRPPTASKPTTSAARLATSGSSSHLQRTSTIPPSRSDRNRVADKSKSSHSKATKNAYDDRYSGKSSYDDRYSSSKSGLKKRQRSSSRSETPPPKRRQRSPAESDDLDQDVSTTIWKMFGRDRRKYVSQDVFSDDDDMEADATALEREEQRSARLAALEDQRAIEDQRRHEEEKRRRKKEKERAARG
ncbi:hypothetical protein FA15DRAFT_666029 [Coprinopsis marcescibilis]|uniref:SPT2-domain-containing protein n=1 Tax=Coprinopsis marcescibilis TaxID=230819 RepID=A0A5C3L5H8_COPMA|nr:hypothetical protein FA15DRAFT_666029 [Coprinopsis marcescibilis]